MHNQPSSSLGNKLLRSGFPLLIVLLWVLQGCAVSNPYYDPTRTHHRRDGFVNSDGSTVSKSFQDLIRWYQERFGKSLPPPPGEFIASYDAFPVRDFKKADIAGSAPTATWLGHASVLLKRNGISVLTDPHFSEKAFPVQWMGPGRKVRSPVQTAQLPDINVVVISHNHYDHMDEDTLKELATNQPEMLFLVPLGVERTFNSWGIKNVKALDWWDSHKVGNTEFTFVPAYHWSARTLLDRNTTLWGGWVVKQPGFSFYFSGDTGYNSKDFLEIGQRLGPFDFSAIAVGAYEPRWFMKAQHINPDEAVQIHKEVGSRKSLGVHWGTFELTDEPLDQPIGDLAEAVRKRGLKDSEFILLEHGQTITLEY